MSDNIEGRTGECPVTPATAQVLELVLRGFESKDIAQRLGISPNTVDGHCRAGIAAFGVSRRKQAARAWEEWKKRHPQSLSAQALSVAEEQPLKLDREQPGGGAEPGDGMNEARAEFVHSPPTRITDWFRRLGGPSDDLPISDRLKAIRSGVLQILMWFCLILVANEFLHQAWTRLLGHS